MTKKRGVLVVLGLVLFAVIVTCLLNRTRISYLRMKLESAMLAKKDARIRAELLRQLTEGVVIVQVAGQPRKYDDPQTLLDESATGYRVKAIRYNESMNRLAKLFELKGLKIYERGEHPRRRFHPYTLKELNLELQQQGAIRRPRQMRL